MTFVEALTGALARDMDDDSAATGSDISQEVCLPAPVRRSCKVSTPVAALIDRALCLDPSERPTIAELSAGFEAFLTAGHQTG